MQSSTFIAIFIILIAGIFAFKFYQNIVRRNSLRRTSDGLFIWVEWNGKECSSHQDPNAPGGAWYTDNSDSNSWGGDGGDAGGDGGGGD